MQRVGSRGLAVACALVGALAAGPCAGQDNVLVLRGKPKRGNVDYDGAKVEFLDLALADQLVHLKSPREIPLRLSIRYHVHRTAPVVLNSRMGTEYWRLYHYAKQTRSGLHTWEKIDLSRPGPAVTTVDRAVADPARGDLLSKGLVGILGHYYFLVDQPNGQWLAWVQPPGFFDRPEFARRLAFTLADLSRFTLSLSEVESTWEPGGPLRVRLTVTDGAGETFPVVNAAATVSAGPWACPLETEVDALAAPTGWLAARLPKSAAPGQVAAVAAVRAMTPDGPVRREVRATFPKGRGRKPAEHFARAAKEPTFERNAKGVIRETRALWVGLTDLLTRKDIDSVVDRAAGAGLNVLVPDIFVRSSFIAKSDLVPLSRRVEPGLDPLDRLIKAAHKRGLEVHPWFCVTYRDPAFRKRMPGVDVIDRKGKVVPLPADVHRTAYRDFIVDLMVGVARDYDVDGIHLDYIRSMAQCYCPACRQEFQAKFGRPLAEASEQDWVAWQQEAIGDIVRRTAEGVRRVRPKAMLSAAVFADPASGAAQGQDPAGWARQGWLDVVIPMDYKMQTLGLAASERKFLAALDDDAKLVTGLSLYTRGGEGQATSRQPSLVRQQIRWVRQAGIRGYCLFVYGHMDDPILDLLRTEINREPAAPYFR